MVVRDLTSRINPGMRIVTRVPMPRADVVSTMENQPTDVSDASDHEEHNTDTERVSRAVNESADRVSSALNEYNANVEAVQELSAQYESADDFSTRQELSNRIRDAIRSLNLKAKQANTAGEEFNKRYAEGVAAGIFAEGARYQQIWQVADPFVTSDGGVYLDTGSGTQKAYLTPAPSSQEDREKGLENVRKNVSAVKPPDPVRPGDPMTGAILTAGIGFGVGAAAKVLPKVAGRIMAAAADGSKPAKVIRPLIKPVGGKSIAKIENAVSQKISPRLGSVVGGTLKSVATPAMMPLHLNTVMYGADVSRRVTEYDAFGHAPDLRTMGGRLAAITGTEVIPNSGGSVLGGIAANKLLPWASGRLLEHKYTRMPHGSFAESKMGDTSVGGSSSIGWAKKGARSTLEPPPKYPLLSKPTIEVPRLKPIPVIYESELGSELIMPFTAEQKQDLMSGYRVISTPEQENFIREWRIGVQRAREAELRESTASLGGRLLNLARSKPPIEMPRLKPGPAIVNSNRGYSELVIPFTTEQKQDLMSGYSVIATPEQANFIRKLEIRAQRAREEELREYAASLGELPSKYPLLSRLIMGTPQLQTVPVRVTSKRSNIAKIPPESSQRFFESIPVKGPAAQLASAPRNMTNKIKTQFGIPTVYPIPITRPKTELLQRIELMQRTKTGHAQIIFPNMALAPLAVVQSQIPIARTKEIEREKSRMIVSTLPRLNTRQRLKKEELFEARSPLGVPVYHNSSPNLFGPPRKSGKSQNTKFTERLRL